MRVLSKHIAMDAMCACNVGRSPFYGTSGDLNVEINVVDQLIDVHIIFNLKYHGHCASHTHV